MPPEKLSMRIFFNFQKEFWIISCARRSRQFFSGFLDFKTGGFCSRIEC
jgi:hypothetical protein